MSQDDYLAKARAKLVAERIDAAEQVFRENMRALLGSPTEQHERLEALIDALDHRPATGIDRTSCPWWKPSEDAR